MRIGYLVHDLNDPAVARRVEMLRRGGAEVALAGFHRGAEPPESVAGVAPISVGRSHDARMAHRAASVLIQCARAGELAARLGPLDGLMARNLEMLALARAVMARLPHPPPLTYEVLDIHRLLLDRGRKGEGLRRLEGRLAAGAMGLVTSSPAFVEHYFRPRSSVRLPVHIVENKLLGPLGRTPRPALPAPPFRVGLFGSLRDRRSMDTLKRVAARLGGKMELVVAGKASPAVFGDLPAELEEAPHAAFLGPYRNPQDLGAIYGAVHFVFAIDEYEAGGNSEWLLPNRLYEAGLWGAVPIARQGTAIAAFLERYGYGIVLQGNTEEVLAAFLTGIDPDRYASERARAAAVPLDAFVASDADCAALVRAVSGPADSMDRAA